MRRVPSGRCAREAVLPPRDFLSFPLPTTAGQARQGRPPHTRVSETHGMKSGRHCCALVPTKDSTTALAGPWATASRRHIATPPARTSRRADPPPLRCARRSRRTRDWLLDQQHADGYWVAELEGDTILESEYILLLAYLGRHRSTTRPESRPLHPRRAARRRRLGHVSRRQAGNQRQRAKPISRSSSPATIRAPNTCSGPARRFWPTAAPTR